MSADPSGTARPDRSRRALEGLRPKHNVWKIFPSNFSLFIFTAKY
jgi:hypothetical protein